MLLVGSFVVVFVLGLVLWWGIIVYVEGIVLLLLGLLMLVLVVMLVWIKCCV